MVKYVYGGYFRIQHEHKSEYTRKATTMVHFGTSFDIKLGVIQSVGLELTSDNGCRNAWNSIFRPSDSLARYGIAHCIVVSQFPSAMSNSF